MASQSSSSSRYSCPVPCEGWREHESCCQREGEGTLTHLINTEDGSVATGDGIGDICVSASVIVRGNDVDEGRLGDGALIL